MIAQCVILGVLTVGTAVWHAHKFCATTDRVGQVVTSGLFVVTCLADVAYLVALIHQAGL